MDFTLLCVRFFSLHFLFNVEIKWFLTVKMSREENARWKQKSKCITNNRYMLYEITNHTVRVMLFMIFTLNLKVNNVINARDDVKLFLYSQCILLLFFFFSFFLRFYSFCLSTFLLLLLFMFTFLGVCLYLFSPLSPSQSNLFYWILICYRCYRIVMVMLFDR